MRLLRLKKATDLNATQKWLLVIISSFANDEGDCWPSQKELAEVTGLTRRTVNSHIQKLNELGYLETIRRLNTDGDLDTCIYTVKIDVYARPKHQSNVFAMKLKHRTTEEKLTDRAWADGLDGFDTSSC